jgi:4-hydroxybenzoate polyprenyltransferase
MKIVKKAIKIYRVKNWYYQLGIVILGFVLVAQPNFELIKILFLGSLLLAFAYSYNDYCECVQKKRYFILPLLLSIITLPLFNYMQILFAVIALMISIAYSIRPIALRERPFLGSIANAVGVPILFLLGYLHTAFLNLTAALFVSLLFCFVMIGQLLHEVTHIKDDKKKKIKTTAVFFGKERIKYFCYQFLFLSLAVTYLLFQMNKINIVFLTSTVAFLLFIYLAIDRKEIDYKLRKIYVSSSILLGLMYVISFYL